MELRVCMGLGLEGVASGWGVVQDTKMDKGGFIIKGTLSCTTAFNILTKTPENPNNVLLLQ